ncbi:MAG: site-2 protease family protein [Bacteroidota bacterium]
MRSLHAGTYWGIPVKIHWTFSLLFVILLGLGWANGQTGLELLSYAMFIVLMFVCVILHEYGHALTARRYGVKTLDIIISPIGGIARLQKLPDKPKHELMVAIAGPLVNLAIAIFLFVIAILFFTAEQFTPPEESLELISTPQGFIALMIYINCVLFLFNLVPAFPMDGGRILRAFLSMRLGKVKGTKYASLIGRIIAVIFVVIGFFTQHIMLIFIGGFVFIMAKSENNQMLIRSKLARVRAKELMNTHFTKLHLSTTLREVYEMFIRGGEKNYLVYDSMGNISGVLPELFIKDAVKEGKLEMTANQYMSNNIYYADGEMTLDKLFEEMNLKGIAIAIIKIGDQVQGVIDRQMLFNFINLQVAK